MYLEPRALTTASKITYSPECLIHKPLKPNISKIVFTISTEAFVSPGISK